MEKLSRETPIFIVSEGSEPQFFTRFFNWDSTKSLVSSLCVMHLLIVNKHKFYSMRFIHMYGCLLCYVALEIRFIFTLLIFIFCCRCMAVHTKGSLVS
jgi:hypothetical protein